MNILLKKDLIVFKRWFFTVLIYYLSVLFLITIFIIFQRMNPWRFIKIANLIKNLDLFMTYLAILFNGITGFILTRNENWKITLTINNRKEIYFSKMILLGLFTLLNAVFLFISVYLFNSNQYYAYPMYFKELRGIMNDFYSFYLIISFFTIILITQFSFQYPIIIQRIKAKSYNNILISFLILITYLLVLSLWFTFIYSMEVIYNQAINKSIWLTIIILLLNTTIFFLNFKLIKGVEG